VSISGAARSAAAAAAPPRTGPARGATALPGPRSPQPAPWLRLVPAVATRPSRGPFALLVVAVLGAGLVVLLLLNTVVAQDSFALSALQHRSTTLGDQEEALAQEVAADASPQRLSRRASALGMVPTVNPAFLQVPGGRILGDPVPGQLPPRPAPKATAKPSTSPSPRPSPTPSASTSPSPQPSAASSAAPSAAAGPGPRPHATSSPTASPGQGR